MLPLIALGVGLLGGLFGAKQPPPPPPPPDHTGDLLKAMQDQHTKDMETINRLIDKLDARDRGQQSQIGISDAPGKPASPVGATRTPSGGGPGAANAAKGTQEPKEPNGIFKALMGIVEELTKLTAKLAELVNMLVSQDDPDPQPQPAPVPFSGGVPLSRETAKAAVTAN